MHDRRGDILTSSSDPSEFSTCLSRNDAIKLLEIIHRSISCNDEETFSALFPRLQELFPFDFANALLGYHDNINGIVIVHRVNISFPKEWLSEFMSRNYMQVDVVVRENFRNYKLQNWADTKMRFNENKEIISLCHAFGMINGYSHGARPTFPDKNGSMFCFSGPSVVCNKRFEAILELVIPHLHLALSHLFNKKRSEVRSIPISDREKEVLNWLKRGKSSWDISVILGISQSTVNFHVSNIMQKLGATNRLQAVAVAAHHGLIEFD